MRKNSRYSDFLSTLMQKPDAAAQISYADNGEMPISGFVKFYQTRYGVLVAAHVRGLYSESDIFAFHIHSGNSCTGNADDPFADAMGHYNPANVPHPSHAGDLPPLFSNSGYAFTVFLTDRFTVNEIIGKTVIIHSKPDDFTTQPSGNPGEKIARGIIKRI